MTYARPAASEEAPASVYVPQNTAALQESRFAEQRRQAEERQREQIEREQLAAERARQEQKAAGHDVIISLDQDALVNVGGVNVYVKIHDNDTTSFDVSINRGWPRRQVPKQKGITHSGTDETLIYDSGSAYLYYVWELSGKLDSCRLRVREH